ncbi:MAG: exbB 2 [Phycisphaerales bacterium]|jgi:biopolymer transport protein ExbB|nr:exbB 2 [Phycisphaerales bacterium]
MTHLSKSRKLFRLLPALALMAAVLLVRASLLADNAPGAAADATPPAQDDAQGKTAKLNAIDLFKKGGIFMYPLAACSILSVAIILERFLALRRSQVVPRNFMPGLKNVFRDPHEDRPAAIDYCRRNDSPIARMLAAGIKRLPRGFDAAEKAIEDAGGNEALKLRRNMRFLYALGSVATLLGLIGTISGMIQAFQASANAPAGNSKVQDLSTGIYEAMVNTFGGLAVAIVVTIFYYFFVGRIERLIGEINDTLVDFSDEYGFNAESESQLRASSTL